MRLNKQQILIANKVEGALLCFAPVGTGKTKVLSARLIKAFEHGLSPEMMLCLTFTNRAATELRQRVEKVFPKQAKNLWVSTFHGLCALILYQEAQDIGLPSDYVVYDEEDSKT